MVDSVKVKITTVQAETTVGVNKSCTYSYNDRGRDRKSLVRSTQFFHTTIADSAIIAFSSKWQNSPTFSLVASVASKLRTRDKDHGIAKTFQ